MFKDFFIQKIANLVKNKTELSDRDVKIISQIFKSFPIPYTERKSESG